MKLHKKILAKASLPALSLLLLITFVDTTYLSVLSVEKVQAQEEQEGQQSRRKRRPRRSREKQEEKKEETTPTAAAAGKVEDSFGSQVKQIDAVIVMDTSHSMVRTDPSRLAVEGAKLFHRFLTEEDRVGVVTFERHSEVALSLTKVTPKDPKLIDDAIEGIEFLGGFTNIQEGLDAALRMLRESERPNTVKCVLLLSDGQMDPHPKDGTKEGMMRVLWSVDMPEFRSDLTRIYTLALSEEADRDLLARIAKDSDGLNWYTPDADSIHSRFADLFLVLKKPQLITLQGNGFDIDNTITEATFYIARSDSGEKVRLLDPRGLSITYEDYPSTVKWFRGERFDIVTIKSPKGGTWVVRGVKRPEGFATLLTDIELQVRWEKNNLVIGDEISIVARVTDGEKPLDIPGIQESLSFTYKIIDSKNGQPVTAGELNDNGLGGDVGANDSIFSSTLGFDKAGDYKALIEVKSPTFTRQRLIPFSVAEAELQLSLEKPDLFNDRPERFQVVVSRELLAMQDPELYLLAVKEGMKEPIALPLDRVDGADGTFEIASSDIPAGEWEILARFIGKPTGGTAKVTFNSEVIDFVGEGEELETHQEETHHEEEHAEEEHGIGMLGYMLIFTSFLWAVGGAFLIIRRLGLNADEVEEIAQVESSGQLDGKLKALKAKASSNRREPTETDIARSNIDFENLGNEPLADDEEPELEVDGVQAEVKKKDESSGEPSQSSAESGDSTQESESSDDSSSQQEDSGDELESDDADEDSGTEESDDDSQSAEDEADSEEEKKE